MLAVIMNCNSELTETVNLVYEPWGKDNAALCAPPMCLSSNSGYTTSF